MRNNIILPKTIFLVIFYFAIYFNLNFSSGGYSFASNNHLSNINKDSQEGKKLISQQFLEPTQQINKSNDHKENDDIDNDEVADNDIDGNDEVNIVKNKIDPDSPEFGSADLGIMKETLVKKNIDDKKPDEDDDKIFLNKKIFDEKAKEDLRNLSYEKPKAEKIIKFKILNRIIGDLSFADNFGDPKNKFYDTGGVLRYYSNIHINNDFEFYALAKLARFDNNGDIARRENDPKGGGSRSFENMGINLSELSIKYSKNNKSLIVGKFTANFGNAWRWNKSIFTFSVPQRYALNEKLGFAGIAKYGDAKKTGSYNLSFSAFTNDRKNFDNSLFHQRDSDNKSMAVAGDTRNLSSFVIANDVKFNFQENEKLSYHFAYSSLSINKNASTIPLNRLKRQKGLVAGMIYEFPIIENFEGETIIEFAKIKNINGDANISDTYFTSNFIIKYQSKYSIMLGNSNNRTKNLANAPAVNNISEINLGYELAKNKFFDKLTTQIGYYQTINKSINLHQRNKAFALLMRYYKNF